MALSNNVLGNNLNKYIDTYCVFDLETTGISSINDSVVEISAVKVINGQVIDEFSALVNPERPIPFYASQVNGITDDMVADCPTFDIALKDFLEFAGDFVLVGHNIHTFDMKFIYRDAEKYWGKTIDNDYIDTLQLAKIYLPRLSCHKLTALAEYYGINTSGAHRALNDCRMNQQIYEHLGKEMKNSSVAVKAVPVCPKCGNVLKKRNGKFGEFWGCSGYPECRFTMNV